MNTLEEVQEAQRRLLEACLGSVKTIEIHLGRRQRKALEDYLDSMGGIEDPSYVGKGPSFAGCRVQWVEVDADDYLEVYELTLPSTKN